MNRPRVGVESQHGKGYEINAKREEHRADGTLPPRGLGEPFEAAPALRGVAGT